MGRTVFAVVLLLAAARSYGAPRRDLQLRSRLLLREIRAEAAAPSKETGRLRAELSALKAENGAAPDEKVSAELKTAETDLALVDAGSPLPPPSPEESLSDEELRDAVAQPAAPARFPVVQDASPATLPDSASKLFDGAIRRGGLAAPAVETPPDDPEAGLDQYLPISDPKEQRSFLLRASAGFLEKLHEPDETGARASYLAENLMRAINSHPKRASFIALRVTVSKDRRLHLIYRLRDGGAVDEVLGIFAVWSTPRASGGRGGGGRRRGKKSHGHAGAAAGDGDAGDGGGSGHGQGHGGRKGHGGGGAGGAAGGDDGGSGDGGGSGAGRGGSGAAHHVKAPRMKGGAGMFDGGGDGGDPGADGAAPGGDLFSGNGPRSRGGRKGRRGGAAGAFGSGRAHARAGRSISGEGAQASASGSRRHGAFVPLPKDFTTRGGGSRLSAAGGDAFGPESAGLGGFHMSALGKREFHHDAALPTAVPGAAMAGTALAQAQPGAAPAPASAAAPSAAAGAAPALTSPLAPDEGLRDAVAGHAAPSPAVAVPAAPPASAPPVPRAPADSGPLAFACACAAAAGLGAYAFRRSRRA